MELGNSHRDADGRVQTVFNLHCRNVLSLVWALVRPSTAEPTKVLVLLGLELDLGLEMTSHTIIRPFLHVSLGNFVGHRIKDIAYWT